MRGLDREYQVVFHVWFLHVSERPHLAMPRGILPPDVLLARRGPHDRSRFDIFRTERDGGLLWIGTADDVREAQKLITQQPSGSRDFVLFDLKTGTKMAMTAGDLQGYANIQKYTAR